MLSLSFDQNDFNDFIIKNDVIGFFEEPIELKSGRLSNWYVNWRALSSDVFLMDLLTDFILSFSNDLSLNPDCFYGVPEGATKLGVLTQYKYAHRSPSFSKGSHVLPMGRAKPKEHGEPRDRFFVGEPMGWTIILEDVTTTGSSILETVDHLEKTDATIFAAFGLTDRMELRDDGITVEEALDQRGVPYYSLSNAGDLLPLAYQRLDPGEGIARAIESEFKKYGVKDVKMM